MLNPGAIWGYNVATKKSSPMAHTPSDDLPADDLTSTDSPRTEHRANLLHGEELIFLDRAIYVPGQQALLLSDLHLGKAETFQLAGIPIAQQVNDETLEELRSHLAQWQPQRVFILGDLFHSRQGLVPELAAVWSQLLAEAEARFTLIVGNHDRAALGDPFDMDYSTQPVPLGQLVLSHEPVDPTTLTRDQLNICGHIHPVVELKGMVDSLRLPCFYYERPSQRLIMRAFGAFTGGYEMAMKKGVTAYIPMDGGMMALDIPD